MLKYERIGNSDRTDINKSNKSKECSICHYWYLKDIGYKFEPYDFNNCHDISMMVSGLENIVILNIKGVDYRFLLWNMEYSKLDDKDTFWTWILVQIKHLLN